MAGKGVNLIDLLKRSADRFAEIDQLLSDPAVISQTEKYTGLLKERGQLMPRAELFTNYTKTLQSLNGSRELLEDADIDDDMRELAQAEVEELEPKVEEYEQQAQELLLLDDELSSRSCIVEIRAGTGGDEASLFAGDLFDMYNYFCTLHDLKIELMDRVDSEIGGIKTLIFRVAGTDASKWFRYEGGTHRVQRVPMTETQGRIHTSAATVAVLPEPEEVEVEIREQDLEISAARSGGPGGQNVNKVASKCILLHKPSGIQVMCQETKSFHQNRERAMQLLRAHLYEAERMKKEAVRSEARASMIGSGDRSEKIRTYNWPQNRCTDHRCKVTVNLDRALAGHLDDILAEMRKMEVAEKLKFLSSQAAN